MAKEARIYNGIKTVSSLIGASLKKKKKKKGQQQVKEIRILPNTLHKNKLKVN